MTAGRPARSGWPSRGSTRPASSSSTGEPTPPALAAFHWTKVHGHDGGRAPPVGEVYVVGVDPAYQGRAWAGRVTLLGLDHLRTWACPRRCSTSTATTRRPCATYTRLGFSGTAVDVMYSRCRSPTGCQR